MLCLRHVDCRRRPGHLVAAWEGVLQRCPSATVFQTPEWILPWWRHLSGTRVPLTLVASSADGPVAIAPLALQRAAAGRVVRFAATGVSDYLDFVVAQGHEREFAQSLFPFLADIRCDLLDLQQVPEHSPCAREIVQAARERGLRVHTEAQEICPAIPLPDTWDDYRAGLGKSMRENVSYYPRMVAKRLGARIEGPDSDGIERLDQVMALHQARWRRRLLPGSFFSRRVQHFHREVAQGMSRRGALAVYSLWVDGWAGAGLYCFEHGDTVFYYSGGFHPALARYSPGTVLVARAIADAIARGKRRFDLLRGAEPYKYRWGAQDRVNMRIRIAAPTVSGATAMRLSMLSGTAEKRGRKLFARLYWRKSHAGAGS